MRMPKQVPAVERKRNKIAAAVPANSRVNPAGWLDILGKAAKGAIGGIMG